MGYKIKKAHANDPDFTYTSRLFILMERMGERMKGSTAENALAKVSTSNTNAYVSCINVDCIL